LGKINWKGQVSYKGSDSPREDMTSLIDSWKQVGRNQLFNNWMRFSAFYQLGTGI
jgi:hypothetical protein